MYGVMFLIFKEVIDGFFYQVSIDSCRISFLTDRCDIPLRVYTLGEGGYGYCGIAEPKDDKAMLNCEFSEGFDSILITDGRIEDKHSVVCIFQLKKAYNPFDSIFASDATLDCIRLYGYFCIFSSGKKSVFAFPTDFNQHPLVHLIPYSYWYKSSVSTAGGFCVIAADEYGNVCFPDETILKETLAESFIKSGKNTDFK